MTEPGYAAAPGDQTEGERDDISASDVVTTVPRSGDVVPTQAELDWYEAGLREGIEIGRRQVEVGGAR